MSSCTSAPTSTPTCLSSHVHCGGGGGGGGSAGFVGANSWDLFRVNSNGTDTARGLWCVDSSTRTFYICGGSCPIGTTTSCWLLKFQISGPYEIVGSSHLASCHTAGILDGMMWKCNNECCWRYTFHWGAFDRPHGPAAGGIAGPNVVCTNGTAANLYTHGTAITARVYSDCLSFCFSSTNPGGFMIQDETIG